DRAGEARRLSYENVRRGRGKPGSNECPRERAAKKALEHWHENSLSNGGAVLCVLREGTAQGHPRRAVTRARNTRGTGLAFRGFRWNRRGAASSRSRCLEKQVPARHRSP